jgi:hypothetical protein
MTGWVITRGDAGAIYLRAPVSTQGDLCKNALFYRVLDD